MTSFRFEGTLSARAFESAGTPSGTAILRDAQPLAQQGIQYGLGRFIQGGARFVHENPVGLLQQGARKGDALLFAAALMPRSRLLGPNLARLPRVASERGEVETLTQCREAQARPASKSA